MNRRSIMRKHHLTPPGEKEVGDKQEKNAGRSPRTREIRKNMRLGKRSLLVGANEQGSTGAERRGGHMQVNIQPLQRRRLLGTK